MESEARKRLESTTRWDPGEVEQRVFERWMKGGWFHSPAEGSPEENFSVAIPPPNVTGALHMGHALNGAIQDAITRMRRMQGRRALWILGTDHAGIATQAVVEKELRAQGTDRHELGREEFTKRVWEWKERYGSTIVEQYKRLGSSCDYERERFTLDEDYVRAVYRVFCELHRKGYIYRDNYIVNWDPGSRSAISDLEVENREVTDTLYEIAYPLEGSDGEIVVATVRPETMLADTAVAVNPEDERYRDLVGRNTILPLVGRRLQIVADDYIDPEFGTGALKVTPGHDVNDFELGRRHGLEEISAIGEDGRMTEAAGRFAGLGLDEAQKAVVEALREEGAIRGEREYTHSVPFSHRSGERIEPLISLQWFCRMEELARPAIEAIRDGRVRFVPAEPHTRVYLDWMERIRPWCISRQLWWGHRLPVWYRDDETYVGEEPPEGEGWEQEQDVLDTWFSSALWPYATLGWPDVDSPEYKAFFPTDFLTTAREILFLWVARMVMTSLEFTGEVPFRDVYVHAVIQAPDGRRMSKSLGTGIDPLDEIAEHGADALRFGLLAMSSTQDVRYSVARVQQGRDLANKMWNASRLILLNATPPEGGTVAAKPAADRVEDRWIASRLQRAIRSVTESVESYDFAHAALDLYDFFWSELCDWYLEIVKPRLYDGDEDASATLLWALEQVLALAHPFVPFVTEEIYSYLPHWESEALVVHPFPELDESLLDEEAEREIEGAISLTRGLRRWRDLAGVAARQELVARAEREPHELVGRLARVAFDGGPGKAIATVSGVELLETEGVDPDTVRTRIEERRKQLQAEVARAEGKLANDGFVAKAPADVVDAERAKLDAYRAELEDLSGPS